VNGEVIGGGSGVIAGDFSGVYTETPRGVCCVRSGTFPSEYGVGIGESGRYVYFELC